MARRPDFRWADPGREGSYKDGADNRHSSGEDIMSPDDLKQLRTNLSRLSVDSVRQAYHTAYARCRMVNDRVPSAHAIQELVQIWKQLWKWR